jgi:hypothetical protein
VQNKIRTAQIQKAYCSMYKLQRYGHTKNYCHLKPRYVNCAGDHLTNQCHRKERSSDVRCVLCDGNHPAKYKGRTVYKDLQKKTYPPPFETIHSSCTNQTNLTHSTRSNISSNNQQNSYADTNIEQNQHTNQPHQETSDM